MTTTPQPQKTKRAYNKKTQNQKSDFESLSFTELVEKAQWHRNELKKIEDFLQEGFDKVLPFKSLTKPESNSRVGSVTKTYKGPVEPPFTQGYKSANEQFPLVDPTDDFGNMFIPPAPQVLTSMKTDSLVITPIEPVAEVHEVVDETKVLEEVRGLLNDGTDLTKLPY